MFSFKTGYSILCQFLPFSVPHPAVNQKGTVSFFGHRSQCSHPFLLLLVMRQVMPCCTWSSALRLIWKFKSVSGASARLLRVASQHENILPVLHHPCWSQVRLQIEYTELVLIYRSHKYCDTSQLSKIIFPFEL